MDMKPSRFTEEQIIGILREQEAGLSTADVCRKHGISSATFYKWKAKYGGLDVSDARRLKALEDENAKLKKPLAEAIPRCLACGLLASLTPSSPCGASRPRWSATTAPGDPALVAREPGRVALHRRQQAPAKRLRRELQWPASRRASEET